VHALIHCTRRVRRNVCGAGAAVTVGARHAVGRGAHGPTHVPLHPQARRTNSSKALIVHAAGQRVTCALEHRIQSTFLVVRRCLPQARQHVAVSRALHALDERPVDPGKRRGGRRRCIRRRVRGTDLQQSLAPRVVAAPQHV
jgi:hypothetical protein